MLYVQGLVASNNKSQLSKQLVLTAHQIVPKPNAQKPLVLLAAAQIKPIQAKPLKLTKPKSKLAADQDSEARAFFEQHVATGLSNAEVSISRYDSNSAKADSFNAVAEAHGWDYMQVYSLAA